MEGRVLIIAGSDSGGGAGIQADVKTVTSLGGYASTALTALTAQNTQGVFDIFEVPIAFIIKQLEVVLDDIGADCIKIGMLHQSEIIFEIASFLKRKATDIPVVVDPVMVAKGGAPLLAKNAVETLKQQMVPIADLLTPNLPEAVALSGVKPELGDYKEKAGSILLEFGAKAVLVKGGHENKNQVEDILLTSSGLLERYKNPRILTQQTHGTGCTLASAIATGLAQGLNLPNAVIRGRKYVLEAIKTAPGFGGGFGPLNHAHTVRPFDR